MNTAVTAWLLDAATWLAIALWLACAVYGLALLLLPGATLRAAASLDRRYSGRRVMRPLEVPRESERFFYRHHRLLGSLLLAGTIAFFLLWLVDFPRETVLARLAVWGGQALAGLILDSATIFLLLTNALITVLAIIIIFRPSLLKPLEARANRWLSTRRAFRRIEEHRQPLDELVYRFPRLAGTLVLLGAIYIGIGVTLVIR